MLHHYNDHADAAEFIANCNGQNLNAILEEKKLQSLAPESCFVSGDQSDVENVRRKIETDYVVSPVFYSRLKAENERDMV